MAKKILISYDFSNLELLNTRLQCLATDPSGAVFGQYYYNTVDNTLRWHNGTAFVSTLTTAHEGTGGSSHASATTAVAGFMSAVDKTKLNGIASGATANSSDTTLLSRANHTGTQTASTISDFDTQVRSSRLDQMAAPTTAVSVNSQKITGLANGTSATDAVNFSQLEAVRTGVSWKQPVRALASGNITSLSGLLVVDGVALVSGDRVAVAAQTTASQNGIYTVAAGAWTRATDADTGTELVSGSSFFVREGGTWADTQWRLTTDGVITVGSTALTFAQIGATVSYTAGSGLTLTGNEFSINASIPRKYTTIFGDTTATSYTLTHGLNNQFVTAQVYNSSNQQVDCDITLTSSTQITVGVAVAPGISALRIVVQG